MTNNKILCFYWLYIYIETHIILYTRQCHAINSQNHQNGDSKMTDIPLWENERILLETKIKHVGLYNRHEGEKGTLLITDLRMVVRFVLSQQFYEMPHNMITSFKWDEGYLKRNNFKITWFHNKQSYQVHVQAFEKKKIVKLLEKMEYYDKPAVLKTWPHPQEEQSSLPEEDDDPLTILKQRYAKGEITYEEFETIKKNLQV